VKKVEKISKKIEDERDIAMSLVSDGQLRGKKREKDEKREVALSNILSLYGRYFCC